MLARPSMLELQIASAQAMMLDKKVPLTELLVRTKCHPMPDND